MWSEVHSMWALVCVIFLGLTYIVCKQSVRPAHFPPGPPCLPILGNLVSIWLGLWKWKIHHLVCQELSNKYGNIIGLKLGPVNVVMVFGKELMKDVGTREVFDGRPDGFFYLLRNFGKPIGIVFSSDPIWTHTRRLTTKSLKHYGYDNRRIPTVIENECEELVKHLVMKSSGKPVFVNKMFHIPSMNVVWRFLVGKRTEYNDKRAINLCEAIISSFKVQDMSGGLLNFMPWLRHIVPGLVGYTELMAAHETIQAFIKEAVTEHEQSLDPNNPRDVIDALLLEVRSQKLTEQNFLAVCRDLLEAGLETFTNTISFLLLFVSLNPRVQSKLHHEIDELIGRNRLPQADDRNRLVYMEATVLETLRLSSVAPVSIPHMALEDATIGKYFIPKGTVILFGLNELHNNATNWPEPSEFRPERFITKEGNLMSNDNLMPFGVGRRRCLGEGIARWQLFLFTAFILQKFHLEFPPGQPKPSIQPVDGVSLSPQPYHLLFKPRF